MYKYFLNICRTHDTIMIIHFHTVSSPLCTMVMIILTYFIDPLGEIIAQYMSPLLQGFCVQAHLNTQPGGTGNQTMTLLFVDDCSTY